MIGIWRRSVILVLAGVIAGCGFGGPPHSDYFVVTFLPNTPAPSQEGLQALASAARQAGRHEPDFIAVAAPVPAQGPAPAATQQRFAAIAKDFTEHGIDARLIRDETRSYAAQDYDQRRDSFIIRLAYGQLAH